MLIRAPALAYFPLLPLACDRSDPATDFSDLLDEPLFSSFDAVEAAFFPVVMARSLKMERVKNAWFMKRVPFVLLSQNSGLLRPGRDKSEFG